MSRSWACRSINSKPLVGYVGCERTLRRPCQNLCVLPQSHLVSARGKVTCFDDTSMKILDFIRPEGDERTGLFTMGVGTSDHSIRQV